MSDDTDWGELDWDEPQPVFRRIPEHEPIETPLPRRRGRPPKVKDEKPLGTACVLPLIGTDDNCIIRVSPEDYAAHFQKVTDDDADRA